ncbi:hypothetical protein [Thermococcus henrietii]|uniref:hypothetical protein n=1 Tax=Thermococcus henrietii TaxID=2016361 RepID=UPI0018D505B1|nr:hypothetical protein [Thermococcus henrietii]
MGFTDLLKKVGGATKKVADRAAKEVKWRKKIGEAKREILSRFKVEQLRRIASAKRIPLYESDPFTGERRALRTKVEIVDKLARNLSFEDVVNLAKRYKIKYSDVVQELEEFRRELFEEAPGERSEEAILEDVFEAENFKEVERELDVLDLLQDFQPEAVRDEEDFEKQLYQFLRARLGSRVRRQVSVGNQKIDIAIGSEVGIELKIAESRSKLQRLVGQVLDYVEYFDEVIAVILDVGANVDIDNYIRKLHQLGAKVVVLEGNVKRRGRSQEIIIKQGARRIVIR